jgi:hypothetical protein
MALRRPSFIWSRERVLIAEFLLASDVPRTPMSIARALHLLRANVQASLERMEQEGFMEADRPYDPERLGAERTFTVACEQRDYVQARVDRFRQRYPLQQWYVEIEVPTAPLTADEEQTLRQAMPNLIRCKQPPQGWLYLAMKITTEHRYEAFDVAYSEFVEVWEHTLKRGDLPNFGVSHTAPWRESTE